MKMNFKRKCPGTFKKKIKVILKENVHTNL